MVRWTCRSTWARPRTRSTRSTWAGSWRTSGECIAISGTASSLRPFLRGEVLADAVALRAVGAIRDHWEEGNLDQGVVYDASRARLIETGEIVKHVGPNLPAAVPAIRWRAVARTRDQLASTGRDRARGVEWRPRRGRRRPRSARPPGPGRPPRCPPRSDGRHPRPTVCSAASMPFTRRQHSSSTRNCARWSPATDPWPTRPGLVAEAPGSGLLK